MRSATLAKLALTATVGIGALIGQANHASAGVSPTGGTIKVAPHVDPGPKDKIAPAPTTTTTLKPMVLSNPVPDPQPDPPFDPDLPIAQPDDDCAPQISCDLAPAPQDEHHGCNKLVFDCDEIAQPDPGCNTTHGCPGEPCVDEHGNPDCLTDGGGTGGTDGGTDGTDGTNGTGTTGGTDGGTDGHGGKLPHTGIDTMAMVGMGLGLTGAGAALKRLGRRNR